MPQRFSAVLVFQYLHQNEVESMAYYDPCCNPCVCNCAGTSVSAANQPSFICANGWMNDYARCALARYDQISYDLDSMPNCCPPCYPCNRYPVLPPACVPVCPPFPNGSPSNTPSYLNATNDPVQRVAASAPVLFATDRLSGGNCIQHAAGTSTFNLNCPGVYLVEYNANLSSAEANTVSSLALLSGGAVVPGSQSSATTAAVGQPDAVGASSIITVPRGTTGSVALSNTSGAEVQVTNANLLITRIF